MSRARRILGEVALFAAGEHQRMRCLREYERTQTWSFEAIQEMQLARATRLADYAFRHCEFYRQRWSQLGIHPRDIKSFDDWQALPLLEKHHIQAAGKNLVSEIWPRDDLIQNQTGGSTGQPVRFYGHRTRLESRAAATMRHDRWAGVRIGDRVAYVWGAPRDVPKIRWRTHVRHWILGRQLWLDTAHVTEQKLLDYVRKLKQFRPHAIVGYAGGLMLLADFLVSRNIKPYRPRSIISSAELLSAQSRERIESVFGCPVFNRYGCREVAVVASECEYHDGMHVMAEGLYVEVLPSNSTARVGSIVVTDLLNYAMPLIRYRIGDVGSWSEGPCACGRGLPRLAGVEGRVTDFLVGADGRLVSGVFLATYVVAQRPTLGQVQISQDEKGKLVYNVCPSDNYDPKNDADYLRRSTRKYLGPGSTAEIQIVDKLFQEPSGKVLFSKSSVAPSFLDLGRT